MIYVQKGPRLWNTLQLALSERFPVSAVVEEGRSSPFQLEVREHPRILIVDDDPSVAEFLSSRLGKCGAEVLVEIDGIRGFRTAVRQRPNLILSDYYMPQGDAHYLLWRLRSTPATAEMPVFVMSGRRLDQTTQERLESRRLREARCLTALH